MNFLRILFTAALAVGLTLLAIANWAPVRVNIGFGLVLDTHLPVLVAGVLLAVALPMWLFGSANRLLLQRRITKLQAALEASETALAQARVELLRPPAAARAADGATETRPSTAARPAGAPAPVHIATVSAAPAHAGAAASTASSATAAAEAALRSSAAAGSAWPDAASSATSPNTVP